MRTIPASMTWEIVRRGRWNSILTILGTIAAMSVMYFGFRYDGPVSRSDKSMLELGYIVLQVLAFAFGIVMWDAQGKVARLYAYPINTSAIVAYRLMPAMVLIALQMMLVTALLNSLFDFGWPILGPALLAAVAFALVDAVAWLTEKSNGWMAIAVSCVGGVLGLWFKSRFGPIAGEPQHFWQTVTPLDLATMLGFAIAAYAIAVYAVARNRRGEPPVSIGVSEWFEHVFDRSPREAQVFSGPLRALSWSEWRKKGWVMPFGALALLVIGFVTWIIAFRSADSLFSGLVVSGFVLTMLGFIGGIILGNTGHNDADFLMNSFLATRPISDSDLARVCLATAAKSLLSAWAIWVAAVGILYVSLVAFGASEHARLPKDFGWWHVVLPVVFAWITTGCTMSIGLTGRVVQIIMIFLAIFAVITATAFASKLLLSPDAHLYLQRTVAIVIQLGIVAVTVWVFVEARRRELISTATTWAGASLWLASTALGAIVLPQAPEPRIVAILLGAVGAALAILPFAAAPLAISMNRHR